MHATPTSSSTALYVARQPILDVNGQVFGYELLYRAAAGDTACVAQADMASASVITNALLDLGLETLTGGRLAFLNVTALVLNQADALFPPGQVVLELLETIDVTPEIVATCRALRARGHLLAVDDFVPGSAAEALLREAAFVKVDVLNTSLDDAIAFARRMKPRGVKLLAEKVETREIYEQLKAAGYELFQGYYFCTPVIQTGTAIPTHRLAYARLLAALNQPNLSAGDLEDLVKQDVSLTLRVLRFANSAAVPNRTEISTIRQALLLIGLTPIRKWASIWCMSGLSGDSGSELATLALVRARCCELLSERLPGADSSGFFLVGLCSLLDVMLSRTMADTLQHLSLSAPVTEALLGHANSERTLLDAVIAYESGVWDQATEAARAAQLDPAVLPSVYTSALRWAQDVTRA